MTGEEVRRKFLTYFEKHNHQVVRSSSLVPQDDPTLLFVNAGMVQFKRVFLGEEKRGYVRAATSQKCVRAGGKHNDLENVGYTARHHTFFEMLGNFSFGDYFKEKAVEFGWDLLIDGYGLPEDKLWVSIYLDDDEAAEIWHKQAGVPEERIVRFGEEDNFWAMGDTGPCGPCSEIHLDRGAAFGCGKPDCKIGCDCDRYLELWNLVFMQFNRDASGKMTPLPKPSIDTGLGLERMASILQNVPTNFDTDLILPIMQRVENLSENRLGESDRTDVAMKVIADHSRAAAFLIGDGILPSNEGRGYVLRRIMRRAIRYGRNIGLVKPFLHQTVNVVIEIMKSAYPELVEGKAFITNVVENEEMRFSETLDSGLKILNESLKEIKAKGQTKVPGQVIFKLYDTYGFPVDIVRDVVREENIALDMDGFDDEMAAQRERSRSVIAFAEISPAYKRLSAKGVKPEFSGYDTLQSDSEVLLLVQDGQEAQEAGAGSAVEAITAVTPFYGEAGGQSGDVGTITGHGPNPSFEMEVSGTVKDPTGLIIHKGEIVSGTIRQGDRAILTVNAANRGAIASNHTATHILHSVLRQVLGDHIKQAGSLVAPDRFRFDFTHFSQIEAETLNEIEMRVNQRIRENVAVQVQEMEAEEAFKSGAIALFEEKYEDRVRMISLGAFSKELCGGTHTSRTGNIGLFKIVSESSVASGVRRIEARTGESALAHIQKLSEIVQETAGLVKDKPGGVVQKVEKLIEHQKSLEKAVEKLKAERAFKSTQAIEDGLKTINGVRVLSKTVSVDTPAALRDLADKFKDRIKSGVIVLGAKVGLKVFLIAVVTRDLVDRYHAGRIVNEIAATVGGKGGGRPDMAQAGGAKPENLEQALQKVYEVIEGV
ncbi:MAG: alanine--tRNA ligase [Desulfobacterales bacterium]